MPSAAFGASPALKLTALSGDVSRRNTELLTTGVGCTVDKVNHQRAKEQMEADRKKAIEDRIKFEELKSRYFGLSMTDGEINLHTLDTIDDYYKVGIDQHIMRRISEILSQREIFGVGGRLSR